MVDRRTFLTLPAAAALWPRAAAAQPAAVQGSVPVIGFLHSASAEQNAKRLDGLRRGLASAGFVEGKTVSIEYRWANGSGERLAAMAAELAAARVAVIATLSSTVAAVAAKKATSTVPIFFLVADPPVELGLVTSLNRPGGNATGITTLAAEVAAKRLSMLHEIVPQAGTLAVLLQPSHPSTKAVTEALRATAPALGVRLDFLEASDERGIEAAYARLAPGTPLLIGTDPLFFSRRAQIAALSARHATPTIADSREYAEAGVLASYGSNLVRLWEQAGVTMARILKGEKPGDLPVVQASAFETVINLKTAKTLGLSVPPQLLGLADDVIE